MMNQTKHGLFIFALAACCSMIACSEDNDNVTSDNCQISGCSTGYTCDSLTKKCLQNKESGESCDASSFCIGGLICGKERICTEAVPGQGITNDPCSSDNDCAIGLSCTNSICQISQSSTDPNRGQRGSKCNTKDDCAGSLKCVQNVCTKYAGLKASCSDEIPCEEPLKCDNNICKEIVSINDFCTDQTATLCETGSRCITISGTTSKCISDDNPNFKDSDNDTIMDFYEMCDGSSSNCKTDLDGDTIPNHLDLDSDGDTIPDSVEAGDIQIGGTPAFALDYTTYAFLNTDSDGNTIPDNLEACPDFADPVKDCGLQEMPSDKDNTSTFMAFTKPYDTSKDGTPDYLSPDNDNDSRSDIDEIKGVIAGKIMRCKTGECPADIAEGTAAAPIDSDGDTLPDYMSVDSDGDGILDLVERTLDSDNDGQADIYSQDSDSDTLKDADEVEHFYLKVTKSNGTSYNKKLRTQYEGKYNSTTLHKDKAGNTIVRDDMGNRLLMKASDGKLLTTSDGAYFLAIELDGYMHAVDHDGRIYVNSDGLSPIYNTNGSPFIDEDGNALYRKDRQVIALDSSGNIISESKCTPNPNYSATESPSEPAGPVLEDCIPSLEDPSVMICIDETFTCNSNNKCVKECEEACAENETCNLSTGNCDPKPTVKTCEMTCTSTQFCNTKLEVPQCEEKEICVADAPKSFAKSEKRIEMGHSNPLTYIAETISNYCYQTTDCDNDGLPDNNEVVCFADEYPGSIRETVHSMIYPNVDGDKYLDDRGVEVDIGDAEEFAAFKAAEGKLITDFSEPTKTCSATEVNTHPEQCFKTFTVTRPEDLICSSGISSKDFIDFSFELEYEGSEQSDTLTFTPSVSKLDLVFNLDVTGSMGKEVEKLQKTLQNVVIKGVRASVDDSAFGFSEFGDFPIYHPSNAAFRYGRPDAREINGGQYFKKDSPWTLHIRPEKDPGLLTQYVNKYSLSDGGDYPESGYESLWMLARGDDPAEAKLQYATQTSIKETPNTSSMTTFAAQGKSQGAGRWGGAGFREGTLPVVVHITDALSHNDGKTENTYNTTYVKNAHTAAQVHTIYAQKGIRLLSVFRRSKNLNDGITSQPGAPLEELYESSKATNAVVKVCAFKNNDGTWACGVADKCCTEVDSSGNPKPTNPVDGKCVLSYGITSADSMTETVVQGIQALVKYGTYDVSTRVRGEDIVTSTGTKVNTSCLVNRIEATEYIAPPVGVVAHDCNPEAQAAKVTIDSFTPTNYNNGFTNFAAGTSSSKEPGAQLKFTVVAQDPTGCVPPAEQDQNYTLYIDVINPTTGLVFGTREMTITIKGKTQGGDN